MVLAFSSRFFVCMALLAVGCRVVRAGSSKLIDTHFATVVYDRRINSWRITVVVGFAGVLRVLLLSPRPFGCWLQRCESRVVEAGMYVLGQCFSSLQSCVSCSWWAKGCKYQGQRVLHVYICLKIQITNSR